MPPIVHFLLRASTPFRVPFVGWTLIRVDKGRYHADSRPIEQRSTKEKRQMKHEIKNRYTGALLYAAADARKTSNLESCNAIRCNITADMIAAGMKEPA